ncbi:MAG: flavodoxin family protein [Bacillota bacterium]
MKIMAVNGSPRGRDGNTDRLLRPFLEGARSAGAETETVYLREKMIKHCTGCYTCWTKTPGVCIHKDDMPGLLDKLLAADMVVYATPLYVFTVSGLMKDFMDRILPLAKPQMVRQDNKLMHPMRHEGVWPKKVVLISNSGYPSRRQFSALLETFRIFTNGPDMEFSASIICPAGELLRIPELQEGTGWYLEAARSAGRELVAEGKVSPETRKLLETDLVDPDVYAQMVNAYWSGEIK